MTDRLYPDALSSVGSLTRAERDQVARVVAADPTAIWPAIVAALSICEGEATLDRIRLVIRGCQP